MHKKWINAIVAVGKRHKWATPLLVALLAVLLGIAAAAEWCGRLWHQAARRVMASALAVCMVFTLLPMNTFAAEGDIPTGSSSLTCHTEHDEDCGYAETIENGGCTHEHNEDCGYTEGSEGSPCNDIPEEDEANTSNDDVHEHDEDCGYAEAIPGTDCTHEHDADCGYTETVTVTSPCTHQCELCKYRGGGGETDGPVEQCVCTVLCTEDAVNADCLLCRGENADLLLCTGEGTLIEPVEPSEAAQAVMDLIDALPSVEEIYESAVGDSDPGYADWLAEIQETVKAIEAAQTAFDALSEEDKAAVGEKRTDNLAMLVNLAAMLPQAQPLNGAPTPVYWSDEGARAEAFAGGDGSSEDNAYQISTPAQLGYMAYCLTSNDKKNYQKKYYKLTGDIDLSGYKWMPMGNGNGAFMGKFDGGKFSVTNMQIDLDGNDAKYRFAGLFGKISGGTVKNVTIGAGSSVTVNYTGIDSPNGYGGVVGEASSTSTIENCHSFASVTATYTKSSSVYVGGIVGYLNKSTVKNCSNSGTIGGTSIVAGGVAGVCGKTAAGTIQNCWNTGKITVDGFDAYAGGVVGYQIHKNSVVKNCYNTGDIEGKKDRSYYGGVAGANNGTIENCYSAGIFTLPDSQDMYAGGLVGDNEDWDTGKAINSYWRKDTGVNEVLSGVGCHGMETDVFSFGNDGLFNESGSATINGQSYSGLLPALNAWVTVQSNDYWFWTGDAASPILTKDPPPAAYAVTIEVNKDGAAWSDHGKVFKLVSDDATVTNLNSVVNGTYKVYESETDTGATVTVSSAAASATVDYYTVTFYDGSSPYASDTPQAPQIVLKNSTATAPEAPAKAEYIFDGWTTTSSGDTPYNFTDTKITAATGVYAKWKPDASTAVTVTLSVNKNAPYYNGDSLMLTAEVTNQSTHSTVKTGKVQFYRGTEKLGSAVGWGENGFRLSVLCGQSTFFPFLEVGDNEVKAVYISASATETSSAVTTLTVSDKQDGNSYVGATAITTDYNGSEKGNCPVQFTITNNGIGKGITTEQLSITGKKDGEDFSDFTVSHNDNKTVVSIYVKKPGIYSFKAVLDNDIYAAQETAEGTVNPAQLTITPQDVTIAAGGVPVFSYTAVGLKGNDTITQVTYTTTANNNYNTEGQFDISIDDITMSHKDCYQINKQNMAKLTITAVSYIITFNVNGGTALIPGTAQTGADGRIQSLPTPTRSGSYRFDGWYTAANGGTEITIDTVFTGDSEIYAHWTYTGSDGGSGSNSDSNSESNSNSNSDSNNDSSSSHTPPNVITPPANKPNTPTTVETNMDAKVDEKGEATVTIPADTMDLAIQAAQDAAKKEGTEDNGVAVQVNILTTFANGKTIDTVTVNLPKSTQERLIAAQVSNFIVVVDTPSIAIRLNLDSIKEIYSQANSDVQLTATRLFDTTMLSDDAKAAIGSRPVFQLTASHRGGRVTDFGKGNVSVKMPYILQDGELAGSLYAVHMDDSGKISYLVNSSYDSKCGMMMFVTDHFSVYGIGYKTPAVTFSDIQNHWAREGIEFVTSRGLLEGTGTDTFDPDIAITRGMFVTALGRLAGIDPKQYENTTFAPDISISREEMAVMMANYALACGYTVPRTREAVIFSDNDSIGAWAKDAVTAMQMAGIVNGKDAGRFDPQGPATRAEAAVMLHRYVELLIDPATAQGLDVNDSGSALMYESGRLVKSASRTVGTYPYSFNGFGEAVLPVDDKKYLLHTVRKNEYFWSISRLYGCTMQEIMDLNGLKMGDIIHPWDTLKIPQV